MVMNILLEFIVRLLLYLIIFIVPILINLKYREKVSIPEFLMLKGNSKKGIQIGIIVSFIYVFLLIIKGSINDFENVNLHIGIMWLSAIIVGLIEEIPFRGFLLHKLDIKFGFIKANLLTTVIFVLLHFPQWLFSGGNIFLNSFQIGVVSFVFGYLVKEYKSLWPSIICHSVFNCCFWIGL